MGPLGWKNDLFFLKSRNARAQGQAEAVTSHSPTAASAPRLARAWSSVSQKSAQTGILGLADSGLIGLPHPASDTGRAGRRSARWRLIRQPRIGHWFWVPPGRPIGRIALSAHQA